MKRILFQESRTVTLSRTPFFTYLTLSIFEMGSHAIHSIASVSAFGKVSSETIVCVPLRTKRACVRIDDDLGIEVGSE